MIEDDRLARSSETRDPPPMHAHPNECTAPFIDGGSLSAIARAVGFHVDHRRLISAFRQKGDLVRAIYYTALAEGERCAFVRRLLNWLACSGFSIATKPAKADVDPPTTPELRGCASIELTIDVLRLANNLDHLNRCLRRRRPALQRKGKRVSVVSTLQAQLTSDDLRVRVDQFIDLTDIQERIERVQAVRPQYDGGGEERLCAQSRALFRRRQGCARPCQSPIPPSPARWINFDVPSSRLQAACHADVPIVRRALHDVSRLEAFPMKLKLQSRWLQKGLALSISVHRYIPWGALSGGVLPVDLSSPIYSP